MQFRSRTRLTSWLTPCAFFALAACGGATPAPLAPEPSRTEHVPEQIVSLGASGSARELFTRGDRAILEGRFADARDLLETLRAAWKSGSTDAKDELEPMATYDLALAYEGLALRTSARDAYLEVERRFPESTVARSARARLYSVFAYLEDWDSLAAAAERALAQRSGEGVALDASDRMAALAARGLARVEKGDQPGASRDVQDALDVMESLGVGSGGRLPTAAAMLRFAQGEVRRVDSEKVRFATDGSARTTQQDIATFMPKMELRCVGLQSAEGAYVDAMRAQDPYFIALGAFRIGEMYKALHKDLMAMPPTTQAKSESQQHLFFAMMHVRYRVLLEKALKRMEQTLALGPKADEQGHDAPRDPDYSTWVKRAAVAKSEMERALEDEKATIATFGYDEATVRRALDILEEKALKAQAEREKRAAAATAEHDKKAAR